VDYCVALGESANLLMNNKKKDGNYILQNIFEVGRLETHWGWDVFYKHCINIDMKYFM
jgi:hypothetical protein